MPIITERTHPMIQGSLTVAQTVEYLGQTGREALDLWRHENRGPTWFKIGKTVYYRKADLDAWISRQIRTTTESENDVMESETA